jgi:hypothetical protein
MQASFHDAGHLLIGIRNRSAVHVELLLYYQSKIITDRSSGGFVCLFSNSSAATHVHGGEREMVVDTPNRLTIAVIVVVSIQMIFSFFFGRTQYIQII